MLHDAVGGYYGGEGVNADRTVRRSCTQVRHNGLGAIFGSNIFNGLFIIGVTAIINPIQVILRKTGTRAGTKWSQRCL